MALLPPPLVPVQPRLQGRPQHLLPHVDLELLRRVGDPHVRGVHLGGEALRGFEVHGEGPRARVHRQPAGDAHRLEQLEPLLLEVHLPELLHRPALDDVPQRHAPPRVHGQDVPPVVQHGVPHDPGGAVDCGNGRRVQGRGLLLAAVLPHGVGAGKGRRPSDEGRPRPPPVLGDRRAPLAHLRAHRACPDGLPGLVERNSQHGGRLLHQEGALAGGEIRAVHAAVPPPAVDVGEAAVHRQGPDAVLVHPEGLHAALLPEVPELDRVVRGAREAQPARRVHGEGADVVHVPLQLHLLAARAGVPHAHGLVAAPRHQDRPRRVHRQAVHRLLAPVAGDGLIRRAGRGGVPRPAPPRHHGHGHHRRGCRGLEVPEEHLPAEPPRGHEARLGGGGQRHDVVRVLEQGAHALPLVRARSIPDLEGLIGRARHQGALYERNVVHPIGVPVVALQELWGRPLEIPALDCGVP
mmetsp:Transcript_56720/g.179243  ORF Transcript_56720/g.179243 Transcript_56720/m.179243 type:complete len:465 (-) Transcript_56720:267-1661(-)